MQVSELSLLLHEAHAALKASRQREHTHIVNAQISLGAALVSNPSLNVTTCHLNLIPI